MAFGSAWAGTRVLESAPGPCSGHSRRLPLGCRFAILDDCSLPIDIGKRIIDGFGAADIARSVRPEPPARADASSAGAVVPCGVRALVVSSSYTTSMDAIDQHQTGRRGLASDGARARPSLPKSAALQAKPGPIKFATRYHNPCVGSSNLSTATNQINDLPDTPPCGKSLWSTIGPVGLHRVHLVHHHMHAMA